VASPSPRATPHAVTPTSGRSSRATTQPASSVPKANTKKSTPLTSKGALVRFGQIFTWIDTPARVAFTAYCVVALIVAMWMGLRIGRRRARRLADLAADAQLSAVMSVVPDAIV